jgi:hypothetical protein
MTEQASCCTGLGSLLHFDQRELAFAIGGIVLASSIIYLIIIISFINIQIF